MSDQPDLVARATDAVMKVALQHGHEIPSRLAEIIAINVLNIHDDTLHVSEVCTPVRWDLEGWRDIILDNAHAEWWNTLAEHRAAPLTMPEVTTRTVSAGEPMARGGLAPYDLTEVTLTGKIRFLQPPDEQRDDRETTT